MGYICDFCGDQRSIVYCRSDAASLCLSCDRNIHSANALSKRHSRTLLCERCNSHPAVVRCTDERVSLCQNCDWMDHGTSTTAATHKRQPISCYSGCPSASELSSIWSFVLESPASGEASCTQGVGLMSIAENEQRDPWDNTENTNNQNLPGVLHMNDGRSAEKSSGWAGISAMTEAKSSIQGPGQIAGSAGTALPKVAGLCEDDFYDDFNMDEMDLNLENYDELFGVTLHNSEELFENGGIDSLFGANDISAADSYCQGAAAAEGSSVGLGNAIQPACSAASADSMMSAKTDSVLCFNARQANSNLSFGESSGGGDYQDCGGSSMLLMGEPPWFPSCHEVSFSSANRSDAVMRYKEKKKTRKFDKRVRYASRKARADVRKRVKGRFVKAGDAYDYDPMSQTRSI